MTGRTTDGSRTESLVSKRDDDPKLLLGGHRHMRCLDPAVGGGNRAQAKDFLKTLLLQLGELCPRIRLENQGWLRRRKPDRLNRQPPSGC